MRVKNVNGATGRACAGKSWLEHWMSLAHQRVAFCPVRGCFEPVEVGSHVQKDGARDGRWYIVPLCKRHDAKPGVALELIDTVPLVPAEGGETGGR
jgi:hypothetical protein